MVHFFVFADDNKKLVTGWAKKLIAPEYLTEFFRKMVWLISFEAYCSCDTEVKIFQIT